MQEWKKGRQLWNTICQITIVGRQGLTDDPLTDDP